MVLENSTRAVAMGGEHPTRAVAISREMKTQSGKKQTIDNQVSLSLLTLQSSPVSGTQLEARRQESPGGANEEVNLLRYSKKKRN